MARKFLRIKEKLNPADTAGILDVLSDILKRTGGHNEEAQEVLERHLAVNIKYLGVDSNNAVIANCDLALFHWDTAHTLPHRQNIIAKLSHTVKKQSGSATRCSQVVNRIVKEIGRVLCGAFT